MTGRQPVWLDVLQRRAAPLVFADTHGRNPCKPARLAFPEDAHGLPRSPAALQRPRTLLDYDPATGRPTRQAAVPDARTLAALEDADAVDAYFVREAIEERQRVQSEERELVEEQRRLFLATMAPSEAIHRALLAEKAVLESA